VDDGLRLIPYSHKLDLKDPKMAALSEFGIAVHHAGLELGDRKVIEEAFLTGKIYMIVCTSVSIIEMESNLRLWLSE
jgi:hypothetical protein